MSSRPKRKIVKKMNKNRPKKNSGKRIITEKNEDLNFDEK